MNDVDLPGGVVIPGREIKIETSRSSGPGGQHVNKTETRVTLRFSVAESPSLPEAVRERLQQRLQSRLTKSGELLVSSERYRDQRRNQEDAWDRLRAILRHALFRKKVRRKTKPTRSSVEKRLIAKRKHAQRKQWRGKPGHDD